MFKSDFAKRWLKPFLPLSLAPKNSLFKNAGFVKVVKTTTYNRCYIFLFVSHIFHLVVQCFPHFFYLQFLTNQGHNELSDGSK